MMRVGELVRLGDRRGVGLRPHLEVVAVVDLEDRRAGLEREPADGRDDAGVIHVNSLTGRPAHPRRPKTQPRKVWTSGAGFANILAAVRKRIHGEGRPMSDAEPQGSLTLQTIAMPADTNANGDIFGGWLMAQMDLASSVLARDRARGPRRDGRGRGHDLPSAGARRRRGLDARRDGARGHDLDDDRRRGLGAAPALRASG